MPIYVPGKVTLAKEFTWNETVWNPSMLSTALWLDAADASTIIESGGAVSQWNDKSGNGNNVFQGTAQNQPTYTTGSIAFDGAGDSLSASSPVITASASGAITFFSVSTFVSGESGYLYSSIGGGEGTAIYQNSESIGVANTINGIGINQVPLGNFDKRIVGAVYDNTNVVYSINGTVTNTSAAYNFPASTLNFVVGNRDGGTTAATYWEGAHHEIVITNSAVSGSVRQRIEGYLAHKWGLTASLPADHPYKTVGPTP